METSHVPPPLLYEHNPNIFVGGDSLAWLSVHTEDDVPAYHLGMVLPGYEDVRRVYAHTKRMGGTIHPLTMRVDYLNGTTVSLFPQLPRNPYRMRGMRFDYCWVPPELLGNQELMDYVSLAVRPC